MQVIMWHLHSPYSQNCHDDVIKWKHFPRYWPFLRVIPRSPMNFHTKASDAELCCFLWSGPWINGWVNTREAGDLWQGFAFLTCRQTSHTYEWMPDVTQVITNYIKKNHNNMVSIGQWAAWHDINAFLINVSDDFMQLQWFRNSYTFLNPLRPSDAYKRQ